MFLYSKINKYKTRKISLLKLLYCFIELSGNKEKYRIHLKNMEMSGGNKSKAEVLKK